MKPLKELFLIFSIYFQLMVETNGQSIFNPIKAASLSAIGGQSVAKQRSEAFPGNAANLASIKNSSLSLNAENRFTGSGIIGSSLLAGIKLGTYNALGLGAVYYGLPEYNQINVMSGYGMRLSNNISIGTGLGAISFMNPAKDKNTFGMIQFGIQYELFNNLLLGASYHRILSRNPIKDLLVGDDFLIGIKYSVSSLVAFYTEFEKDNNSKSNIKVGIDYQMIDNLTLSTGITSYPQSFSTGLGFDLSSRIHLDASFSFYQSIGLTPALGIKLNLTNPTE